MKGDVYPDHISAEVANSHGRVEVDHVVGHFKTGRNGFGIIGSGLTTATFLGHLKEWLSRLPTCLPPKPEK